MRLLPRGGGTRFEREAGAVDGPPPGARRGKGDPANRTADPRVSELEFAPELEEVPAIAGLMRGRNADSLFTRAVFEALDVE